MIRSGIDEDPAPGCEDSWEDGSGASDPEMVGRPDFAGEGYGGEAEGDTASEEAAAVAPEDLQGTIEAILFSSSEPVTVRQLAEILEVSIHDVREAVENLRLELADTRRAFRLHEISGGLQLLTEARFHPWISRFHRARKAQRLSSAAMETLSLIAYKQPITKADLESTRGVQCGPTLKTLMDRGLVKIVGREDSIGKPLLYGTTARFLESFGLASIKHLPEPELDAAPGEAQSDE